MTRSFIELAQETRFELQRFVTRRLAIVAVACRLRMHNWIVRQIRFVTSNVARFGVCLRL